MTQGQPQSGAVVMDADTAISRFYTLAQGSRSLPAHMKDFYDIIDTLEASRPTKPNNDLIAIRFLASLNTNRYASWKVDIKNNTKAGLDVIPKTLKDAYSRAFLLKKVGETRIQPNADASVFVTTGNGGGGNTRAQQNANKDNKRGNQGDGKPYGGRDNRGG